MSNSYVNFLSRPWTQKEIDLLRRNANRSCREIQQKLAKKGFERSLKAIRNKLSRLEPLKSTSKKRVNKTQTRRRKKKPKNKKKFQTPSLKDIAHDEVAIDTLEAMIAELSSQQYEGLQRIMELQKKYKRAHDRFVDNKTGILLNPPARKIVSISDLHIPFERTDLIEQIVEDNKDADVLVINGDFLEVHTVSTWTKYKHVVLFDEYIMALRYLEWFSSVFPKVVLVRGNHEKRLNRYFAQNLSPVVSFLVDKEILDRLAEGQVLDWEGNIVKRHNFDNVLYEGGPEGWYVKIGKTMFLHPDQSSVIDAKVAIKAQEYFMEREDVDCLVVGHTHKIAWIPRRGKLCIEQGCLCYPLDYERQGKFSHSIRTLGYAVVYQGADGSADFNRTRAVYLGTRFPVKEAIL